MKYTNRTAIEKAKNIEGFWTFTHSKDLLWEHAPFTTKNKAITAGRKIFPCGFVIGQLSKSQNMEYVVENIEKLTFS